MALRRWKTGATEQALDTLLFSFGVEFSSRTMIRDACGAAMTGQNLDTGLWWRRSCDADA